MEQTEQLTVSFNSELEVLFTYLLDFLSILLFLKLFHSGYTLLQRFRHEYFIFKLIGMSNWQLELLFLQIILLIGNIGVFLGFFIGIVFPEMLVLILKAILNSSSLYLIPSLNDMIVVLIISNSIFFVTSYLAF